MIFFVGMPRRVGLEHSSQYAGSRCKVGSTAMWMYSVYSLSKYPRERVFPPAALPCQGG